MHFYLKKGLQWVGRCTLSGISKGTMPTKSTTHTNPERGATHTNMKITQERCNGRLTNVYHISDTCLLRDTVGKKNNKGEPVATLISKGQADEVRYPASVLSYLKSGLLIPSKYFPCMD